MRAASIALQVQRHVERDAVVGCAGLEAVVQLQARVAEREVFREAVGLAAFARHQLFERPLERGARRRRQLAIPLVERDRAVELRRQALEVPAGLPILVGHQARAAQLRFFFACDFQRAQVARQERGAGIDLTGHQALAHEDLARLGRIQTAVVHRPLRREHQAEQADLLGADDAALAARPVRVVVLARQQVRQLLDHPVRLDAGIRHAPDALRVEQHRRQHPRRRLLRQRGAGDQLVLAAARPFIDRLVGLLADLGRQTRDQGAVQRAVVGERWLS